MLKQQDIKFLSELQTEMLVQDRVSQADPRFWVIMDYKWVVAPEGFTDDYHVCDCENSWTLSAFYDYIKEMIEAEPMYACVERLLGEKGDDLYDMIEAIVAKLNWKFGREEYHIQGVREVSFIVSNTMFLTIKEAKQHLKDNHYHYTSKAHVYAMTAWRAPQVERLIKLLQTADFDSMLADNPDVPEAVLATLTQYDCLEKALAEEYFNNSAEEIDDDFVQCWIGDNFDRYCNLWMPKIRSLWLLVETIRIGKYRHYLFESEGTAITFLKERGAKYAGKGKWVATEKSLLDGWRQERPVHFEMEQLRVR